MRIKFCCYELQQNINETALKFKPNIKWKWYVTVIHIEQHKTIMSCNEMTYINQQMQMTFWNCQSCLSIQSPYATGQNNKSRG